MGKLVVVLNDAVKGKDKHNVVGQAQNPAPIPPVIPYVGIGTFDYEGKMLLQLSDFVRINGKPVAIKTSQSMLNPQEPIPPVGKHSGPQGKMFIPPVPKPIEITLNIIDPIGIGKPSVIAGSSFVKINGIPVLLDKDKMDTCDGLMIPMNSTVTASNQNFVSCSG